MSVDCPKCGTPNPAATHLVEHPELDPPAEGDISICWNCAGLATFTGDGVNVRPCTEAERAEALDDPACIAAIGAVLADKGLPGL